MALITTSQAVAGATQYTDAVGSGRLVTATWMPGPVGRANGYSFRLVAVGYSAAGDPHAVKLTLRPRTGTTALGDQLIRLIDRSLVNEVSLLCPQLLPAEADNDPWEAVLETTGKTGNGELTWLFDVVPTGPVS